MPISVATGCLLGLVMLAITPSALVVLYPMAGLAAGATWVIGIAALLRFSPSAANGSAGQLALVLLVSLIVFWIASRADHRLATSLRYRRARHVVRLLIVGTAVHVNLGALNGRGLSWSELAAFRPGEIAVVLASIAAAHLTLTRATSLRNRWHGFLKAVGLRPRSSG